MIRVLSAIIGIAFSLTMTVAKAGTFEMVSLNNSGQPPTFTPVGSSWPASVTPDGRYVVFAVSATGLVSDPTITNTQIYLRDRVAGSTELISQSVAGAAANGNDAGRPTISNDGCRVAFMTWASNLVPGDNNGTGNVFVRNRCANPQTTEMVDVFPDGSPGTAQGLEVRISGDGRKAVFVSYTKDLVTGLKDHNGFTCGDAIYVRDLDARVTTALMRPDGGCLQGREPDLSSDGSRIAFFSIHPYVGSDTNGIWDIYLYDSATNSVTLVSADENGAPHRQTDGINGGEGSSTITAPAISQDGRIVAFRSRGFGLVPSLVTTSGISQLYVKDTYSGDIIVASVDSSGTTLGNADSSGSGAGTRPGLSADGQFVVFKTAATNLVPETGGFVMHDNFGSATTGFTNILTNTSPNISPSGRHITTGSGNPMDIRFNSRGIFLLDLGDPANPTNLVTRYRLYSDGTKEHLYTTDLNEYSVLSAGGGWLAEGAIYKLFQGPGSLAGVAAVPYYRLYNPLSFQHHWTTDQNEYNVLGTRGWSKEGVDGYILPTAVSGSVPLYRLYLNAFGGLHLWTTDANEKNVLSTSNGWVDEGVAGWVVPLP